MSTLAPARITVQLPANAKLYVDNTLCPLTSEERTFTTKALETDREYYYTLRMETVRNGEIQRETRRVTFRGGQEVTVRFGKQAIVSNSRP